MATPLPLAINIIGPQTNIAALFMSNLFQVLIFQTGPQTHGCCPCEIKAEQDGLF